METEIRLVLLIIGIIIICAIFWDGKRRQNRQKNYLNRKLKKVDVSGTDLFTIEQHSEEVAEEFDDEYEVEEIVEEKPARNFRTEENTEEFDFEQDIQEQETPEPEIIEQEEIIAREEPREEITEEEILPEEEPVMVIQEKPKTKISRLVLFSLIARSNKTFGGFKLLQVLLNHGFRFGDMHIFHYHENNDEHSKKLFSLAAATETGEFDLAHMANFSCKGLVIFMNSKDHANASEIFDEMVEVTEALAKSLSADLKIGHDEAWSEANLAKIYEELI